MLSRRIFRELTDSFLLEINYRPTAGLCIAAQWQPSRPCLRNIWPSIRNSSSSSSTRWKSRQGKDVFSREARVQGLKSRAAFKLLEVQHQLCL
jgi:21S rRNA (uridine2791-2'-O)-methyltransferase